MRRLAAGGDRPAALLVYDRPCERLRRELSIAPSGATRQLAQELRSDAHGDPRPSADPAMAAPRRRLIGLVGREAELERLRAAWQAAREGSGGVGLVAGPAGIGKTRLLAELADLAAASRGFAASGAVPELGAGAPLSAWAELCGELVRACPAPAGGPVWAADLAPLVPAALAWAPHGSSHGRSSPDLERARLFEGTCEWIAHAAGQTPLLLLVEDVHAADRPTLELLGYVARRLRSLPVLVVASRREPCDNADVDALVRGLRARGSLAVELSLGPLPDEAVATLVEAVGSLPSDRVPDVVAAAEGSPLLALEAARAAARAVLDLAAGLGEIVRSSFAGLGAAARTLVQVVAVAGGPLPHGDARALIGDASAETFAATVAAASGAGLLESGERHVDFRHALLRTAAYEEMAPPSARLYMSESPGGSSPATTTRWRRRRPATCG